MDLPSRPAGFKSFAETLAENVGLEDGDSENDVDYVDEESSGTDDSQIEAEKRKKKGLEEEDRKRRKLRRRATSIYNKLKSSSYAQLSSTEQPPGIWGCQTEKNLGPESRQESAPPGTCEPIDSMLRRHLSRTGPKEASMPRERRPGCVPLGVVTNALNSLKAQEEALMSEKRVRFAGREFVIQVDATGKKRSIAVSKQPAAHGEFEQFAAMVDETIGSKQQITSVQKSQADWRAHTATAADRHVLEEHRKSISGFLGKRSFLEKAGGATELPASKRGRL